MTHDGVVIDKDAGNGSPDLAATATHLDEGIGGGSSNDRDNKDHNTDGDRHHCHRPHPRWAVMAVTMMTIAGKGGGEAIARQWQCESKTTMR